MRSALVVPTNRQYSAQRFIDKWKASGVHFDHWILVEDGPTKSFEADVDTHVSWKEIEEDLKEDAWIISRRDSAIRSYGFLLAHRLGVKNVFTLDDDCYPLANTFVIDHVMNLERTPKWISSVPDQRTRGLPYKNKGWASNVMLSVGLWEGVPDYDSIQMLSMAPYLTELPKTRVMPAGQYFPICGMNMCMRSELLPLTYFPLMGEGYPYRRFDDIWFGIICKKVCDHLHWLITCGEPYINHSKASDPFVNLEKEAPGIVKNEYFWEIIDQISLTGSSPTECMYEIGESLKTHGDPYISKVGEAIIVWTNHFKV